MSQSHECFLEQLAKSLYHIHGQQISDLTIVFPNRRAGLFFIEYLNRLISNPCFSPEIITIQELFSNISQLHTEEQLQLIFRLYRIYIELSGSKENFDEFYLWGEMLLHDFDQVDKYLVDAELLFTNITDLKEIDEHFNDWNEERVGEIKHFWKSLTSGEQKLDQKEFARLWQVLYPIYKKLKSELLDKKIAFEGMLFRDAVENSESIKSDYLSGRKFIVAGFNALNACEKMLFQFLQNDKNIQFYWDFDHYYLDDINQEAGLFMRENLKLFPQEDFNYQTNTFIQGRTFQIFYTPSQVGQAQIASREVAGLVTRDADFDDTAIVLCDEELLLPVLSAISGDIDTVNVTMGLPIRQTPVFSLINLLIVLQKKSKSEDNGQYFYYKSVVDILNNQLIQSLYPIESKYIVENIIKRNLLFVSKRELCSNDFFNAIFNCVDSVSELPDYFLSILYTLFLFWEQNSDTNYAENYQEYIYQVYLSVNQLNNTLFTEGPVIMGSNDYLTKDTFFRLLLQYIGSLNVTFEGEPLAGLQIMGILETRTLDFKNIVLLSVNEGIMPKANVSGSFIPYHLRKGVGLPTVEEQNAMYAYYFYRLLQRAEKVSFIYNSGTNGLKTGEKSRFLYQLQLESQFDIVEQGIESSIDPLPALPISIEKEGEVLAQLNEMLDSGKKISPTALDLFIQCPLSYYFKYLARIDEEEDVTDEIDARMFGKIFHSVMESVYLPLLDKIIDQQLLESLVDNQDSIELLLKEAFALHFFKSAGTNEMPIIAGRNRLVYEVIKKMVNQVLKIDLQRVPFTIIGLERKVNATIPIFQGSKAVRIGGVIDRIDSISDSTEIIDYKTGATEHNFYSLSDLFDGEAKKRNKAAFQTMVYGCIWDKMYPDSSSIYPGIYALKKIFKQENSRLTIKENGMREVNYPDLRDEFEPKLVQLLEDLFNPALPFTQTKVEEHCQFCPYRSICNK
jgi:hypothetical protein